MALVRTRLSVLISGRGSNMLALADWLDRHDFPIEIVQVLSNKPEAAGLELARKRGIFAEALDHRAFASREAYDAALADRIESVKPDWIVMAGFMRILTEGFCARFARRMLNIHPSLLPAYVGLHTHERALADGVRFHGLTVHGVTPTLDHGPILAQALVPVLPTDTAESLAARVLEMEHRVYPQAIAAAASGRMQWTDEGWRPGQPRPGFESLSFSPWHLHPTLLDAGEGN